MSSIGELLSKGGNFFGGGFGVIFLIILLMIPVICIIGAIFYYFWKRKQWNLKVEFKIPRGIEYLKEGELFDKGEVRGIVNKEWGKGSYNSKRGVVFIKRKGVRKIAMKPFNITKYLSGGRNILSVVQVGAEHYIPVLEESYLNMVDDKTGEEAALIKTRIDTGESKVWKDQFERSAKSAYSIMSLLRDYAPIIGVGLILMFNFIGFAILYGKMG